MANRQITLQFLLCFVFFIYGPRIFTRMESLLAKSSKAVADPGENLTGSLHSRFWRGGRGGRGSWIYAMILLSKTQ